MIKYKTLKEAEKDYRINYIDRNYSGTGTHCAVLKRGFLFWGETGSTIGNAALILDDINNHIEVDESDTNARYNRR